MKNGGKKLTPKLYYPHIYYLFFIFHVYSLSIYIFISIFFIILNTWYIFVYQLLGCLFFFTQVKKWMTINEPWSIVHQGYSLGVHAPGRCSDR